MGRSRNRLSRSSLLVTHIVTSTCSMITISATLFDETGMLIVFLFIVPGKSAAQSLLDRQDCTLPVPANRDFKQDATVQPHLAGRLQCSSTSPSLVFHPQAYPCSVKTQNQAYLQAYSGSSQRLPIPAFLTKICHVCKRPSTPLASFMLFFPWTQGLLGTSSFRHERRLPSQMAGMYDGVFINYPLSLLPLPFSPPSLSRTRAGTHANGVSAGSPQHC